MKPLRYLARLPGQFQLLLKRSRFNRTGHGNAWRIFTHVTPEERLLLFALGLRLPPGAVLLEIGSYLGSSTCFLAAAAEKIGGGAKVFAVDTWRNDGMSEGRRDTYAEFSENTATFGAIIVPLRGPASEIALTFSQKISLLFIDGDHSYEAVSRDIDAWFPHLSENALVIFHDSGWAEGVQRAINEKVMPRAAGWHNLPNMAWGKIENPWHGQ